MMIDKMNGDLILLFFGLAGLFLMGFGLFKFINAVDNDKGEERKNNQRRNNNNININNNNNNVGLRNRRGRGNNNQQDEEVSDDDDEEEKDGEGEEEDGGEMHGMNKEERRAHMKKLKKQAKKEKNAAEIQNRNSREEKMSAREAQYRAKIEQREILRLQEEEKAKKEAEIKAKKDQEEYAKWREMYNVEEGGVTFEGGDTEGEEFISSFINHIKTHKVVVIQELAAKFNIKSIDVNKKIQNLEEMGKLSGIFDERGKYIYITMEEMEKVASFVNQQGRMSISNLVSASNSLINLNPSYKKEEKE